uniref:uncharacterized protein LOC100186222 n=1 Tax=Ciona intestinalis TaxID=7719 RepID=UPI000180C848|nr:uncharacterized protein LOC100186222 [Ciona intestinalis]|eukprot:XP_002128067.1 uncharacterized protein LOC100186222 [Ciona intestinalis]
MSLLTRKSINFVLKPQACYIGGLHSCTNLKHSFTTCPLKKLQDVRNTHTLRRSFFQPYNLRLNFSTTSKSIDNNRKGVLTMDEIYNLIVEENGRDITVIKLSKEANYADYFTIVTANSSRHLVHMAETLNRLYKVRKSENDPFCLIEGKRSSREWQCIDVGNVVVHFMLQGMRDKYQMEKLWLLGPKYDDLTREMPTIDEMIKQATEQGLRLMSTVGEDHVNFLEDSEIINPWEIAYKEETNNSDTVEFDDDDEYIV